MANRKLPAKFANETECIFCGCQYLLDESSTNEYCSQCVKNGYKVPDDGIVRQQQEVLYSKPLQTQDNKIGLSSFRPKKCKLCGNEFNPKAPAQKICPACKLTRNR